MNAFEELVVELQPLLPAVADLVWVEGEIENVARIEAEIRALRITQAANHEARDDEKHERAVHLGDHESRSQAAATAGHGEAAIANRLDYAPTRGAKSRNDADDQAGNQNGAEGIAKYAPVEVEIEEDRGCCAQLSGAKRIAAGQAKQDAGDASAERQQHALRKQLADETKTRASQRRANSHLTLAHCRANQQEICHIDACQDQDESGKDEEQYGDLQNRTVRVGPWPGEALRKDRDGHASFGLWVLFCEAVADDVERGLRSS